MQYHVQRNAVATTDHSVGFDCHLLGLERYQKYTRYRIVLRLPMPIPDTDTRDVKRLSNIQLPN